MRRLASLALLISVGLFAENSHAAKPVMLNGDMPTLGITVTPDSSGSGGFTPAPTPNQDIFPPSHPTKAEPEFAPSIATPQHTVVHPGQGYTAGSAFTDDLGRRHPVNALGVTPTLSLKIPLQ